MAGGRVLLLLLSHARPPTSYLIARPLPVWLLLSAGGEPPTWPAGCPFLSGHPSSFFFFGFFFSRLVYPDWRRSGSHGDARLTWANRKASLQPKQIQNGRTVGGGGWRATAATSFRSDKRNVYYHHPDKWGQSSFFSRLSLSVRCCWPPSRDFINRFARCAAVFCSCAIDSIETKTGKKAAQILAHHHQQGPETTKAFRVQIFVFCCPAEQHDDAGAITCTGHQ